VANPEHVDIVKQGAEVLNNWREDNPDIALDLQEALLVDTDLSGTDLSYSKMTRAKLYDACLDDAKLEYADATLAFLGGASLRGARLFQTAFNTADLIKADFSNADLGFAYLAKSFMKEANFSNSNLFGVNFYYADLDQSIFNKAVAATTLWSKLDLSKVIGLESIVHNGPSSIDIDTLIRSGGKIPEVFLRGCGLSDEFISYIPSHFSGSAIDFYSCFISYSHEDKSFARRLFDALQGRGIRCWLDEHQILPGDNIYERIDRGIKVWDKVLLCASQHSLTSPWVDDEVTHAFAKEKELSKQRGHKVQSLIPLNLDGYIFSGWNHPKKNQVLEHMAADFTGWQTDNTKFELQLERVVKALQTNNTGREPEPKSKL
tara:strand:- start:104881 stop:106005 length:1125 start_codon:yes stop_codon:yes gene_type:complete